MRRFFVLLVVYVVAGCSAPPQPPLAPREVTASPSTGQGVNTQVRKIGQIKKN
ncbi:MAG: hypothetical protein J0H02_08485 [Armatimonadetes bacterium]|nr:hypothetical protein [Armatimonadota bacterium]